MVGRKRKAAEMTALREWLEELPVLQRPNDLMRDATEASYPPEAGEELPTTEPPTIEITTTTEEAEPSTGSSPDEGE